MKISDNTTNSSFLISSILTVKKNNTTKQFKLNRRSNNRLASLSKSQSPTMFPINNYQIVPMSSISMNNQQNSFSTLLNPDRLTTVTEPSTINHQNVPTNSTFKMFTTPRVTTTLIPLNICPIEYCQTVKPTQSPTVNIIENYQQQNKFEDKSKHRITTHLIGDWIIRESSEPFRRKENEQTTNQEKQNNSNESNISCQSLSSNVNHWTIDDVCLFFERVLGKNSYTSIIKEHLIDGVALLLLLDEHLIDIFKMQLGPRLKLLNHIEKLKNGEQLQL